LIANAPNPNFWRYSLVSRISSNAAALPDDSISGLGQKYTAALTLLFISSAATAMIKKILTDRLFMSVIIAFSTSAGQGIAALI